MMKTMMSDLNNHLKQCLTSLRKPHKMIKHTQTVRQNFGSELRNTDQNFSLFFFFFLFFVLFKFFGITNQQVRNDFFDYWRY